MYNKTRAHWNVIVQKGKKWKLITIRKMVNKASQKND